MENKGQLGTLQGVVLSLVVIGVLIGAAFLVMGEFQIEAGDETNTVLNETGAFFNSSGYTVSKVNQPDFKNFAVSQARNGTDGEVIDAEEYTVNPSTGKVTNATSVVWSTVQLDYTYDSDSQAAREVSIVVNAMKKVPAFLGLIILIAIVAVVVGLIFSAFPTGASRGGT